MLKTTTTNTKLALLLLLQQLVRFVLNPFFSSKQTKNLLDGPPHDVEDGLFKASYLLVFSYNNIHIQRQTNSILRGFSITATSGSSMLFSSRNLRLNYFEKFTSKEVNKSVTMLGDTGKIRLT